MTTCLSSTVVPPSNPVTMGPPPGLAKLPSSTPPGFDTVQQAFPGGLSSETLFDHFSAFLRDRGLGHTVPSTHAPTARPSAPLAVTDSSVIAGGRDLGPSVRPSVPTVVGEQPPTVTYGDRPVVCSRPPTTVSSGRGAPRDGGVRRFPPATSTVTSAVGTTFDASPGFQPRQGAPPFGHRAGGDRWAGYMIPRNHTATSHPPLGQDSGHPWVTGPNVEQAATAFGGDLYGHPYGGHPSTCSSSTQDSPLGEEEMEVDEPLVGEERQGEFSDVLSWLWELVPETRPPPPSAPGDRLLNSVLAEQATDVARPEVRLPPAGFFDKWDSNLRKKVFNPGSNLKGMGPGQYFSPDRLKDVFQWRGMPHMTLKQHAPPFSAGALGHGAPNSFSYSAKEFDSLESFARHQLLVSNFLDRQLVLMLRLLDQETIDTAKLSGVVSAAAKALNQSQSLAFKSLANLCLKRRDAAIRAFPPGAHERTIAGLRASSFLAPALFDEGLAEKAATDIRLYADTLRCRQPAPPPPPGARPQGGSGRKRSAKAPQQHQPAKRGRGSGPPRDPSHGRGSDPPPPPGYQPFRGAASGKSSRGGRRR